jgi:hypothetical protein
MSNITNRVQGGQGLLNIYCNDIKKYMNLYDETNNDWFAELAEESASKILKLFDYNETEDTSRLC